MHGFLSRDGIAPREFLRIAREQLATYDERRAARRRGDRGAACRDCTVPGHARGRPAARSPRKLLIATGVRRQPAGHPRLRASSTAQRVSLSVLRRLGSARSAARDLRPRRSRARAVARADRLEPRPRAVHRRAVGDRRRRPWRGSIATASACARTASRGSRARRAPRAHRLRDRRAARRGARCSSRPARRSSRSWRPSSGCEMNDKGTVRTGKYEATHLPGLYVAGDASRAVQWVDRRGGGRGRGGIRHQHRPAERGPFRDWTGRFRPSNMAIRPNWS